jgi:hypothetical protein
MNNHTITSTKNKPKPGDGAGAKNKPSAQSQPFGVIKIRDVWLNDMGDGPSLIWDNKARKWRKLGEELHDLILSWEWPFGRDAVSVGSESWNIDSSPWVIDYYIAIRWELIEEHGLEWAVVDRLEARGIEDLRIMFEVHHPGLPTDV